MLSHDRVHLIAIREVLRTHKELNIDKTRQIDIFIVMNELGIPLAFQPLRNLSGAFIPSVLSEGTVAGILVNENHPKSRQRFTAAHEYCHYLRDSEASFDIETEIIARDELDKYQDRERIAEAFAAWFLMPKELVESQCDSLGIVMRNITPVTAYQLSLSLGTSYSATVNHLFTLQKISWNTRKNLLQVPPKEIKKEITEYTESFGWHDVWIINEKSNNSTVVVQSGDEIRLNLGETPSTGYIWCSETVDCPFIEVREDIHNTNNSLYIGQSGKRSIVLSMKEEGFCDIVYSYKRPWIENDKQADKFILSTYIEGKRHGINIAYLN